MRIALFVPQLSISGGLGVYCRCLLAGLLRRSAADRYLVLIPAVPEKLFPYSGLDDTWHDLVVDPRVQLLRLDWPADQPLSLPVDRVLAEPIAAHAPDLLHCTYYTGMIQARCPQLVTFHDAGYLEFPERFGDTARQRRAAIMEMGANADGIVCTSQDARGRIVRLLPFPAERIDVVPLALTDPPEALTAAHRSEWLTQPLWPEGDVIGAWGAYLFLPVGAATGFNRVRKNVPTAVAAFRALRTAGVKLIVASTGILHPKLLEELLPDSELHAGGLVGAAWRSADDAIRILPNLEREGFLAAMARARAVVYPTRYEGFGLPTIEAMALGVPLIAGRATSIPEIVADAGLLVDPDDVPGFAAAFDRILHEPALTDDLVRRGKERVRHYTLERLGEEMFQVYERIVMRRRSAGERLG